MGEKIQIYGVVMGKIGE